METKCPHCESDVKVEIATCIGCGDRFARVVSVGRPKVYHSDDCKTKYAKTPRIRWADDPEPVAV